MEKTYKKSDKPKRSEDKDYSVDVIVLLDGMLNIAFFCFEDCSWSFHTDTLINPEEVKDFKWIYKPSYLK